MTNGQGPNAQPENTHPLPRTHPQGCTPTRGMPHLPTTHVGRATQRWALQHVGDSPARGEQAEGVVADGAAKNVVYLAAACLGSLGHVAEYVQRYLGGGGEGKEEIHISCVFITKILHQ